jgi:hypothetical protein
LDRLPRWGDCLRFETNPGSQILLSPDLFRPTIAHYSTLTLRRLADHQVVFPVPSPAEF